MSGNSLTVAGSRSVAVLAAEQEKRDFVTMTIAGQMFGIPVLRVQDVLRSAKIARIPLVAPWIAGHSICAAAS